MDLRKRRDDETYRAATLIAVVAVSFMTLVMISLAIEVIALPESNSWLFGRRMVMRMGMPDSGIGSDLLTGLLFLISFGAGLVSKRTEHIVGWRLLVYCSCLGVLASLISMLFIAGDASDHLAGLSDDIVPNLDQYNAVSDVVSRVRTVCGAVSFWFCGQIATQFGLKLPKVDP